MLKDLHLGSAEVGTLHRKELWGNRPEPLPLTGDYSNHGNTTRSARMNVIAPRLVLHSLATTRYTMKGVAVCIYMYYLIFLGWCRPLLNRKLQSDSSFFMAIFPMQRWQLCNLCDCVYQLMGSYWHCGDVSYCETCHSPFICPKVCCVVRLC